MLGASFFLFSFYQHSFYLETVERISLESNGQWKRLNKTVANGTELLKSQA